MLLLGPLKYWILLFTWEIFYFFHLFLCPKPQLVCENAYRKKLEIAIAGHRVLLTSEGKMIYYPTDLLSVLQSDQSSYSTRICQLESTEE